MDLYKLESILRGKNLLKKLDATFNCGRSLCKLHFDSRKSLFDESQNNLIQEIINKKYHEM